MSQGGDGPSREDVTRWGDVAFGLALSWLAAFSLYKVPPALPLILERYETHRTFASLWVSIYPVLGLLFAVPVARFVARGRARAALRAGCATLAAGGAIGLVADPGTGSFLFSRAVEGFAFAIFAILGPVLAQAGARSRDVALVLSLAAIWVPVGQVVAVVGAAPAFALAGWRGLWWLGLVFVAIVSIWAGAAFRPGPPRPTADASSAVLEGTERRALWLVSLVFVAWGAQYWAFMTWITQYLVEAHSVPLDRALVGSLLPVVIVVVSAIATGAAMRRGVDPPRTLLAGVVLQFLVWCFLPFAVARELGATALVAYGAGAGISAACLFALPGLIAGSGARVAAAFGILMVGRNLGGLLGPPLLAEVFRVSQSWDAAAPIFASVTGVAVAASLALCRAPARARSAPGDRS